MRRIPDQVTVWRWIRSFGSLLKKLIDSNVHRTGYEWSADEPYIKYMGREMWLFDVMDTETRFVMDYDILPDRMRYDATSLFAGAAALAGKAPNAVATDVLSGLASGLRGVLPGGRRAGTLRRKDVSIRKRHSNNTCERFNRTLKDRLKSVRVFHSPLPVLHVLYLAYYNLFRPHSSMSGKMSAEALDVILKGSDKWPTAIRHAVLLGT